MSRRRRGWAAALALLAAVPWGRAGAQAQPGSGAIESLVSQISFGIPSSPAFALLPGQASEVQHVVTPHDFQSAISTWTTDGKLHAGAALDFRPFSTAGSLREYQQHPSRQIAWRTVFSAGTAQAADGSTDVMVAAGLRIPVIDRADPRADPAVVRRLENAYQAALLAQGPPGLNATPEKFVQRADSAAKLIQPVRDSIAAANWNRLKWDLGVGLAARAHSGVFRQDSLTADRGGFWTSLAVPVGSAIQASGTAKLTLAQADSAGAERVRGVVGGRLRVFPRGALALSAEAAQVFARYRDRTDQDESWTHVGVLLEFPSTFLAGFIRSGWIGVGYGGDLSRAGERAPQLSLQYAFYQNRVLKR
ncbi:MAG TPA: hypothetical protein VFJ82_21610 [Longimicrobium sp.]|nr:hypothetical protein [Longimicrobium sp.]